MTTPLEKLLEAVPTLNSPQEPFVFTVDGHKIVGSWDIVKATTLYVSELETIDKKYKITVTFDQDNGTYDFNEVKTSSEGSVKTTGASFRKEAFSGKSSSKEFSFSFGGLRKTKKGITAMPLVYSFSTAKIKDPLFDFLKQNGWKRKQGLLSRLFNR